MKSDPRYSEQRACRLVGWWRSSYRYRRRRNDEALRAHLRELVEARPRFGYRRLHALLRREKNADGTLRWMVNRKRMYRVYREEGLAVRRRKRKSRAVFPRQPLAAPHQPNEGWSMEFIHDTLASGRKFPSWSASRRAQRCMVPNMPSPPRTRTRIVVTTFLGESPHSATHLWRS